MPLGSTFLRGLAALSIAWQTPGHADPLADLDRSFRTTYTDSATQNLRNLRAEVPVILNRFGQIAFFRPGVDTPEVYSMDLTLYLEARSVAHAPVAVVAKLITNGPGRLKPETLDWLDRFEKSLAAAEVDLAHRTGLARATRLNQQALLVTVRRYVQRFKQRGEMDQAILDEMGRAVRPGIRANLDVAAASQLEQFRGQINRWQAQYPTLPWRRSVVVVLGVHQARRDYLQRQFFDWLLQDQPNEERQIVFAETLEIPPPLEQDLPSAALELLSKVMLDKSIASTLFNDPLALQADVLGKSARDVISRWPQRRRGDIGSPTP